jgi:glutathione S-transferase
MAILEYLAEKYPRKGWWPKNRADRALARAYANEMHSSFMGLRQNCPMNCFARPLAVIPEPAKPDVERIREIWRDCLSKKKAGGFLFGAFTIADAMYAPVVIRLATYGFSVEPPLKAYMERILALPAMREWLAQAALETERIAAYEIGPS